MVPSLMDHIKGSQALLFLFLLDRLVAWSTLVEPFSQTLELSHTFLTAC